MPENQNIEYKENWRDDCLKSICGFANSQGGQLYIGIDDKGIITGIQNYKKLLEDIPNKIANHLGIVVDVNLHTKTGKHYLEIKVPPSSVPISYHGIYHYRSGSTKQELKGTSLQLFLLNKMGKSWDDLPVENADIKEINTQSLKKFRNKALNHKRISENSKKDRQNVLLHNLNLLNDDGQLKNAAILLFGNDPLKYFREAYFKIGRFGEDDADLKFQDLITGNILEMPDKVLEILRSKYLISPISYKGLMRVEELEYPEEALREAILNAIVHKDYTGTSIQMSVYDDKLMLWNPGKLPEGLSIKMLHGKHPSRPPNKNIADVFFKAGFIEVWGRGINKITNSIKEAGLPQPLIEEFAGGIQITFLKKKLNVPENVPENPENVPEKPENVPENLKEAGRIDLLLSMIRDDKAISIKKLANLLGVTEKTIKRDLDALKQENILIRIGPAKGGYWQIL